MKSISISIPKPCHEDWNKMTPNEQGAHCAVCAKTVVDFSNKTDIEIIDIFEKKKEEKVCGRFAPSQLSRPVVSFNESDSTSKILKFVYALLMAFGITLFNGMDVNAQTIRGEVRVKTQGKVAVVRHDPPIQTSQKDTTTKGIQTLPTNCGTELKGDVAIEQLGQTIVKYEPIKITGDTIAVEEIISSIDTTAHPIATNAIEPIEVVEKTEAFPMVFGMIAMSVPPIIEKPNVPVVDTVIPHMQNQGITPVIDTATTKESVNSETIILPPSDLEIIASPNPSNGSIVLSYELKESAAVQIDLFDITGKRVKVLWQLSKQYAGKYNITYNINDLQDGIYIATIIADNKKSSTRIILAR